MKKHSERVLFSGNWLAVHEIRYLARDGAAIAWETVRRKRSRSTVGIVVIAKLVPSGSYILIKQFRPAVGGYLLSFPAGLAHGDPKHALVELKEETGYVGKVVSASPPLKSGASIIDDTGRVVLVRVDEHDPRNKDPRQKLEPGEDIEVILAHPRDVRKLLLKEHKKGTHISANLWYFFVLGGKV